MKPGDGILSLAGLAAGASLMLGAAGMTIAVIGAARPPVSEYFTAAQNAHEAVRVSWLWISPAMTLVGGVWAGAQVVLRRPVLVSKAKARRYVVSNAQIAGVSILGGVSAALAMLSVFFAVGSIRASVARPLTDNMAFSWMSLPVSGIGFVCVMLSTTLFLRWWQGQGAMGIEEQKPEGATRKPDEAG